MAGEKKGKAYEALVYVALEQLIASGDVQGPLHWNVTPNGMSIEPDLMMGKDPDSPKSILLISHCGSAKNSDMKAWRNLGELVEAKTVLPKSPRVYCLLFGVFKADLEPIQQHAFDQFVWVRHATHSWSDDLDEFISSCVDDFPKGKDAQAEYMREAIKAAGAEAKAAFKKLKSLLVTMHKTQSAALDKMWVAQRSRPIPASPAARTTLIRRGASKLFLFPDHSEAYRSFRSASKFTSDVSHLAPLGLVEKRTSGWFPARDEDVLACVKLLDEKACLSLFKPVAITEGFSKQAAKVKDAALLTVYATWCNSNWAKLTTQSGMKSVLEQLHRDPAAGLVLPKGVHPPTHIWLMDVLGAMIRAATGRTQEFGFSTFSKHRRAGSATIGNMPVGTWVSCFGNQYFTRKSGFVMPSTALDFVALVLSEVAQQAKNSRVSSAALAQQYVRKEYEAVYLAHKGFEPLYGLIAAGVKKCAKARMRTCFSEAAELGGVSGTCSLAKAGSTLINWQSAHGSHTNDKKKELCGRAIGLRYHWNGTAFIRRPDINKLILVLDGTWKQADLNALLRAGWDEIYYPDEIDQLAKAIA